MTKDDFIQFIQKSEFLGKERQTDLIENAAWLSAEERGSLAEQITKSGQALEANNQAMIVELTKVEDALKAFKKEELPKLVKEKEKSAAEEAKIAAEELFKKI